MITACAAGWTGAASSAEGVAGSLLARRAGASQGVFGCQRWRRIPGEVGAGRSRVAGAVEDEPAIGAYPYRAGAGRAPATF